jgi:hypothetical protein
VFVSPSWESAFPLCSVTAITRIGSDHCPLILDSGEEVTWKPTRFFFQTWWFEVAGFEELVRDRLWSYLGGRGAQWGSIDQWQEISRNTRQFLKGWGAKLGKEKRELKADLLRQVAVLDKSADEGGPR